MLEFVAVLLNVIQFIVLAVIIGAFVLVMLAGLYLASEEVREQVRDFERWAALRRYKKNFLRAQKEGGPTIMLPYAKADVELTQKLFATYKRPGLIFDQVAEDMNIDPQDVLREKKAQDARDQEIIDRAKEYGNDLTR